MKRHAANTRKPEGAVLKRESKRLKIEHSVPKPSLLGSFDFIPEDNGQTNGNGRAEESPVIHQDNHILTTSRDQPSTNGSPTGPSNNNIEVNLYPPSVETQADPQPPPLDPYLESYSGYEMPEVIPNHSNVQMLANATDAFDYPPHLDVPMRPPSPLLANDLGNMDEPVLLPSPHEFADSTEQKDNAEEIPQQVSASDKDPNVGTNPGGSHVDQPPEEKAAAIVVPDPPVVTAGPSISQFFAIGSIRTCAMKVTKLEGHFDFVHAVDADEVYVASASGDTTIKLWNVEESREMGSLAGHTNSVTDICLLSAEDSSNLNSALQRPLQERLLISGSRDTHIRLWSLAEGREIKSIYCFNEITCIGYLKSEMYAVVGTEGGKLDVWCLKSGQQVASEYAHKSAVSTLRVCDSYIFTASEDGKVRVWVFDPEEGLQGIYTRKKDSKDVTLPAADKWRALDVYGNTIFLGDNTGSIKAIDWQSGCLRKFVNQISDKAICESVLIKDDVLLTSFYDSESDIGGINVWHLPEVKYVGTLTGEDLQDICGLAVVRTKEGVRILSGGLQLLVWDFDFSKVPSEESQEDFHVQKIDTVGLELKDDDLAHDITVLEDDSSPTEKKKSWCTVS